MPEDATHIPPLHAEPPAGAPAELLRAELIGRLLAHDKAGAVSVALVAVRDGAISIPDLYVNVLGPALVEIGTRWQRGETAVWEEHLASSAVRTIVEALYPEVVRARGSVAASGRTALLACPPEEAHELGLRMLADRLMLVGWRVFYLGPDTPAADIAAAARGVAADAVVLTSSTHYHRLRLRELVEFLVAELPETVVWVGGPAFAGLCDEWALAHLFPDRAVFGDDLPSGAGASPRACVAPAESGGGPAVHDESAARADVASDEDRRDPAEGDGV